MYDEPVIKHYGTPRHSGRYPWGSGKNPYQRNRSFMSYVTDLRKKGMTDAQIAKGIGMNSAQLRAKYSIANDENRNADVAMAYRLKEKGYSNTAIGKRMGINESSVRSLLDPSRAQRSSATTATADYLKDQVEKIGYVDVGSGAENYLGISKTKLNTTLALMQEKGYEVHNVKVYQLGTGNYTTVKVLCPPGTTWAEVTNNKDKIRLPDGWTDDNGYSWELPKPPVSVSKDRLMVRYGDEGGKDKDGVIELRRGVEDLSLGDARYAQVRIAVDGTHYLKGMAVYSDDMPKGVDIIFNTNKNSDTPVLGPKGNTILKRLETDKDGNVNLENPFKATIKRQRTYTDKNGKEHQSAINIVNEQGDWEEWKKVISSQVLSKQSPDLAKKQLALYYDSKKEQYDEIEALTNPVIKKKLLESFADDCDASAVHLEAAAMPRQASHVLLPLTSIKDTEVYAPGYNNGERVVLIRYPHAGKFEIPELTVNNRNPEGKNLIGNDSRDAIGISSKVAQQLSGADFDGDTVLVIPNNKTGNYAIKTNPPIKSLQEFDPKEAYPKYDGMVPMTKKQKGLEMGKISNLITDMTIQGAPQEEITRAVKHSMVVIDAEKHELNWKQSYVDQGIAELSLKYQGKKGGGAATLISRSTAEARPNTRREYVDPSTGKKVFVEKDSDTYVNKSGKTIHRTTKSTRMAEVDDAYKLVSGGSKAKTTAMERVYADHANSLKSLANKARKEAINTKSPGISATAKETYKEEVASLKGKLNIAKKNRPKERQAQIIAGAEVAALKKSNPQLDTDSIKKAGNRALTRARLKVGANKKDVLVEISDREWEAIQAHAIGKTVLEDILRNTDEARIKELATPRKEKSRMTPSLLVRAKAMINAGCTLAEAASVLGVSSSTLSKNLKSS